jgi:fumarylacetoacetate (FAA) hydrolase
MKFVSFRSNEHQERLGLYVNERIYDIQDNASLIGVTIPGTMLEFLRGGEKLMDYARKVHTAILDGNADKPAGSATLLAPVPRPPSCRDAYAFRQHVAAARRNRNVEMIPEFDQYPIFYFTNHNAVYGEGDILVESDHLQKLDFELEAAVVIGKRGKNITSKEADSYIAGYTIMNDWSARVLQMEEMKLNLGPAKGKDFATCIGPWLVTPDELADVRETGEFGDRYSLRMTARHNGALISDGNMKDMTWTFAEIIERCAYGVEMFPGDVIGSGTVGTGCYLELNGTHARLAKEKGGSYDPVWIETGDTMELAIERLGVLRNRVVQAPADYSILAKKKNV